MSKVPPEITDPLRAAEKERVIAGCLPLDRLPRLGDSIVDRSGEVRFSVRFSREGAFLVVRGFVEAELALRCQCCLLPVKQGVHAVIALGIISSLDEEHALPDSLEPLLVGQDESVSIVKLVEDELLLAIPHVPRHPDCVSDHVHIGEEVAPGPRAQGAFANLDSLIKLNKQAR